MRIIGYSLTLLLGLTGNALADEITGEILAYDRVDHVIVLEDKSVWNMPETLDLPADLKAGDRIRIQFTSAGDSGVGKIDGVTLADD